MTEFQRTLAFDVGDRRIGIAVSDLLGITAQPVETYTRTDDEEKDIRYLLSVAKRYAPSKLVFGMPRNMNGTYGFQAEKVRVFAEKLLENWDGEYDFYDERLTTVTAERILLEADVSRKKRKQVVDKIAAVVILQGYLDSRR
ncbi:MAG: Holliday junction resolvase RuvX [Clostridia bacterium]|nr:Holliday junction resolvase RuvX [Clostridia bacterium]MBR0444008.1 Holliday junction resolvase RuvX [Clostridia bacterium]